MEIEETCDLDSHHSAVILTLRKRIIKKEARPMFVNKTSDQESFRIDLQKEINLNINLKTTKQLDIKANNFTKLLQTATLNNTKEITHITKILITHLKYEIQSGKRDQQDESGNEHDTS